MGLAASVSRTGRRDAVSSLETSMLAKVQPVCNFVNAEAARLRHQTIAIGTFALGGLLLCLFMGIGDPRIPLVVSAGVFAVCFLRARAEFASSYTNIAAKRIVSALGRGLAYRSASSLTRQQFVAMDLFSGVGERWNSRDEIGGRMRGVKYSLHQVHAAGLDRKSVAFGGVVIKIDFDDPFPGHIVVIPDHDGQLPGSNGTAGSRVKKDLVMLKNPAFERKFSVYATDYYEARRLVTPSVMECVMEAAATFRTDLRLAFVQKSLFVAVAGDALRAEAALFGSPLTPHAAVGRLLVLVAFAERLANSVAG